MLEEPRDGQMGWNRPNIRDLAIDTEDIKCAHTFLSFYQKDKGNLLAATHHARNLLEYGGTAKEEAKRLLHIINSLKGNDIV
ncbi:8598_t:CDS:2 [Entrophospora sp. SA101]|nr:8598_t:CDS:2 [Entrophospora sp. SA101]